MYSEFNLEKIEFLHAFARFALRFAANYFYLLYRISSGSLLQAPLYLATFFDKFHWELSIDDE
jgi:hypothetical protein